ncbi:MAG: serine/threonine-protein kinase [Candidatus Sulfotelmatobacter sp.]
MEIVHGRVPYERDERIGVGEGMNSSVFRARDPRLERQIAVKEIEKARLGNDIGRYFQEAKTMSELDDPNIVPIHYACDTDEMIGLVMPYFPNGSLRPRISSGPTSVRELIKLAQGVFSGVARVHSAGFVHLDLKPSNVLFTDADIPMVADFGQSRQLGQNNTVRVPPMYPCSIPPEVWDTFTAIPQSDIYQLGVLLYRVANGDPVYNAQRSVVTSQSDLRQKTLSGKFPNREFFLPHIPRRVRTAIRKALKRHPEERFHSVLDLANALGRVPSGLDWKIQSLGGGAYRWSVDRPGKKKVEVELASGSESAWTSKVWTTDNGQRRAKGRRNYWASGLTYASALKHLTEVFLDLEA